MSDINEIQKYIIKYSLLQREQRERFFSIFDNDVIDQINEMKKPKKVAPPTPRNFVAKNAQKTGAGAHEPKKYTRKEKYKKPPTD